jgi:hypothetical protein
MQFHSVSTVGFLLGCSGRDVNVTSRLCLVLRLTMNASKPSLTYHGVDRDTFTFTFHFFSIKWSIKQVGRFHHFHRQRRPLGRVEVYLYSVFLDLGTRKGEESASRSGRYLPPGKTRYTLYRRLDGPQGRSGQLRKISPKPGFDPRTVQPVASRYTD